MNFITFLHRERSPASSIASILSALSYKHKFLGYQDPTKDFKINQLLQSVRKVKSEGDSRLPITIVLLERLITAIPLLGLSTYEILLYKAMFLLCFHFALRVGEVTSSPHNLLLHQLVVATNTIELTFISYKHSQGNLQKHTIHTSDNLHCPVFAMKSNQAKRGTSEGPLFTLLGKAVPRQAFSNNLKKLIQLVGENPSSYSSHSFRIGAASYWATKGLSELQIKNMGRWKSNALFKYIRGFVDHSL